MKILMISTEPITKNGISSVIMNIVSTINTEQFKIDLVCKNKPQDEYYELFGRKGGNIYIISRDIRHPIKYIVKLSRLIKKEKYDVVHAHGNSSSLIMEMLGAIFGGAKIRIAHSHNTTCSEVNLHKLLNPFFQLTYTFALACGEDAGRWMFGNKDFKVINNGISTKKYKFDANRRDYIRKNLGIEQDEFVIGHVGVFNNQKNHSFLLNVFVEIKEVIPNVKLLLVGDGRKREEIQRFINEKNIGDKVFLAGNVNNVNDYLSAMDLVLMPSLYEGLPVALIEEQANGLHCIVSDTITKEVDKTGLVSFLPITDGTEAWVETTKMRYADYKNFNRMQDSRIAINKVAEAGYSIEDEIERLEMIYSKL